MLIGEVSRRCGVSTRMLRHYDALGLVSPTGRTAGGYREYSPADLQRIFHVESLRSLGLSLDEVQRALDDPGFSPAVLVGRLVEQTERRLATQEELLSRLRRVQATDPSDWDDVLRIVVLLRGISSHHPLSRQRAALSSGSTDRMPPEVLADAFLGEADPNVAGTLRWALVRTGRAGLATLAAGLTSEQDEVRQRAVEAIAGVDGDEANALLLSVVTDPDRLVRSRAALALGSRGVPDALPVLTEMVADGNHDVEAAEVLGLLAAATGTSGDVVRLLLDASDGAGPQVRLRVVQALAELTGPATREALSHLAGDEDRAVAITARAIADRLRG